MAIQISKHYGMVLAGLGLVSGSLSLNHCSASYYLCDDKFLNKSKFLSSHLLSE